MAEKLIYKFSDDQTSTHKLILSQINKGSRVLDIGCASGYMGEILSRENGCEVWGIEPDSIAAEKARAKGYKAVSNKNVEDGLAELEGKFDSIILADVLEHVINPDLILEKLKNFLGPEGRILVSLPNIAHYSVRWSLLRGKWEMRDWGILDRTHLHFYNLKTARELLEKSGFKVESVRPRGDLERWLRKIGLEGIGKLILFSWPELFAIQFILKAKID